jgi:hypothetical protein
MGGYTSKCEKSQNHCTLPYIFIICLKILLLKIELLGGGIIVGRLCTNLQGQTVNSVNEVFADDLTAVFCMSVEAVRCILNIFYATVEDITH